MRENTPTYTFIGAMFAMPDTPEKEAEIICVGDTPGWQKLNRPYLKDGKPVCGSGTREPDVVIPF